MKFEFATASRIIFETGGLASVGALAAEFGIKALIVSGCPGEISDRLTAFLKSQEISFESIRISGEPTLSKVRELVEQAHQFSPHLIIGIGGGSAIDYAKTVAALLTNSGDVVDYLEVIGAGKALQNPSLPLIAIPTTSGTGSEVTRNAVLGAPEQHVKISLRSPYLLPIIALVDPELILSLPPEITAATGLDALTQLIEPYTCLQPNPITDAICLEGIKYAARSIYTVYDRGADLPGREDMALASLMSGMALANAKLGAVHGLAAPIGGVIPAPHGAICARLLPFVMEANIKALQKLAPYHPVLERYITLCRILTGDPTASAEHGIQFILDYCQHTEIQPLAYYGLNQAMFIPIIESSLKASSMKGNPVQLTQDELRTILERAL